MTTAPTRPAPKTADDTRVQAFTETVNRKLEMTRQLSQLKDEHDAYRIELMTGRRDPDPTYEYESKIAAKRLRQQLRGIEESMALLGQIANSNTPDAPRYRELFERAGMSHRLDGSIPHVAPTRDLPQPEARPGEVAPTGHNKLIAIGLIFAAAIVVRQIILMMGRY
jgi:hypothetical protein